MSPLEPTPVMTAAPAAAAVETDAQVHPRDDAAAVAAPAQAEGVFATRSPAGATRARARARVGVDWLSWSTTSLVVVAFFVLIVSGRVVTEGPVLLVLTATHGIHEGDLFALAAACGGIAMPVLRGLRRR